MPSRGCVYSFPGDPDGHHLRHRGYGRWLHVHHRPNHLDHQLQQLHHHDHGGGVDLICINHFIDVGRSSNTLALAPTTLATSPTMPTTRRPLSCYKGRQIDDTDLLGLSTKLLSLLTLSTKLLGLLTLTTCHIVIMIATKNGAMTTATTVMTTRSGGTRNGPRGR